jgi:hypothetical protein
MRASAGTLSNASAVVHSQSTALMMAAEMVCGATSCELTCDLREMVPPEIWNVWGERSRWFVDCRILWTRQALEEYFQKKVKVNDWHLGGSFRNRGYRLPDSSTGARLSQHRFGRAIDADVIGLSAEEVRTEILTHPEEAAFQFITTLEEGTSWLHADCRDTVGKKIQLV